MGEVAYRGEAEFWTKGGRKESATTAWADANRTEVKGILSAWNEANNAAWSQFGKVVSEMQADQQQLRLQLEKVKAQLASQELHKAAAEYGSLMRNSIYIGGVRVHFFVGTDNVKRHVLISKRNQLEDELVFRLKGNSERHQITDQREESEYSGVRALRPFRDATGAVLLGAAVSGLIFGWAGDKQTIELIGATVGVTAYVIARIASAHAKSKSNS
jgi:hypothetical protein